MLKGEDLLEKVKYEIKHNLDFSAQTVQVPIKDLNLLIELAEKNQYRLDMDLAERILELEGINQQFIKYENALKNIDNHIRLTSEPTEFIIEELKKTLPEYSE